MIRVDLRRAADMNCATADNPVAEEAAGARQRIYAAEQHKAWRLILYGLKLDTGRVDGVVGSQESLDFDERPDRDCRRTRPQNRQRSDMNCPSINDPVTHLAGGVG